MRGDHSAARALLRLYRFNELAAEIKHDHLPFSPRVRRMVLALTAGTGEGDQPGKWEYVAADGRILNLLQNDDAPPFKTHARQPVLEGEEP